MLSYGLVHARKGPKPCSPVNVSPCVQQVACTMLHNMELGGERMIQPCMATNCNTACNCVYSEPNFGQSTAGDEPEIWRNARLVGKLRSQYHRSTPTRAAQLADRSLAMMATSLCQCTVHGSLDCFSIMDEQWYRKGVRPARTLLRTVAL